MSNKKYYWLKLKRDFFKRHDIQIIEAMDNGKDYVLFYLKILLESIDHEGSLRFSEAIPYNEKMLATITNTNVDIVKSAMEKLMALGLVEILSDSTIYMNEVERMLGSETYWAEQKRKQKQNKLIECQEFKYIKKISYEQLQLPNGKIQYVDNKRFGGNAFYAFELAQGKCEKCGTYENLCIHHKNGYSNDIDDLEVLCRSCHRKSKVVEKSPTEIGNCPQNVQDVQLLSNQEKDIDKDRDKDKENNMPLPKKTKHKYGQYKNVLLTDEDLEKLKIEFSDWSERIERLSEYMASKGKAYKNHLATIRSWSRREQKIKPKEPQTTQQFLRGIVKNGG